MMSTKFVGPAPDEDPAAAETAGRQADPSAAWAAAHPSVRHFQALFRFGHLPAGPLRSISSHFSALADRLVLDCPSNPELAAALRKLREAKDCAVTTFVVDNHLGDVAAAPADPSEPVSDGRDLLVIVPTRSRPENVERVVNAWVETNAFDHAELLFVWDQDDPAVESYIQAFGRIGWSQTYPIRFRSLPRQLQLVPKLNDVALDYARQETWPDEYFALGFAGDDHSPRTRGWARFYLERLRELGTGIVSCPDGYREDQLPTQWAMTADIVRELGSMVPAPVEHLYCDDAIRSLAEAAGCYSYLGNLLIEHMHPVVGKGEDDAQYQRVNSSEQFGRDRRAYRQWRRSGELAGQAALIRQLRERTLAT